MTEEQSFEPLTAFKFLTKLLFVTKKSSMPAYNHVPMKTDHAEIFYLFSFMMKKGLTCLASGK